MNKKLSREKLLEKLNKEWKWILSGRTLRCDLSDSSMLTKDELKMIKFFVELKFNGYVIPTIVPISQKHHLDFIGYDTKFMDIFICQIDGLK